jgi:DNA-binding transcriptional MerR regulator
VLRYWEQEFTQLRPVKRRGNRRYYQHHEVLLIRRIRELLYEQGFTINGARNKLDARGAVIEEDAVGEKAEQNGQHGAVAASEAAAPAQTEANVDVGRLRKDLIGIIELLRR